jgi:lambda family phage portal protein
LAKAKAKPKTAKAAKRSAKPRRQSKTKTVTRIKTLNVRGKYDAAQTDAENRRHWALADGLSAVAANSKSIRQTLRDRSRYEVANNSYARGIINTVANHTIGTGPRLQVETGDMDADEMIEAEFAKWAKAVNLGAKLRTMNVAKRQDGESFAVKVTNEKITHPVKLDLRLFEAEHVTAPEMGSVDGADQVDGIDFDAQGNPTRYHVLKEHPGGTTSVGAMAEFESYDASDVFHWFRCDRPGQARGIPEIMPALPLFAQLRRYTLSTVAAAETAADFTAVLQTDVPADDETTVDPMEEIEINRRMMTTLPAGWKLGQFEAKQPVTGYKEFKGELLNEISRCLDMPFNIAACNSSGYNYSSGRLDHQTYYRSIAIEQSQCEVEILRRLFVAWLDEAALANVIPGGLPDVETWEVGWFWDGIAEVDAEKEANADEKELTNGNATLSSICARKGLDWRKVMRQRAKELQYQQQLEKEFGVRLSPIEEGATITNPNGEDGAVSDNADQAANSGDVQATALNGAQIASLVLICDKLSQEQYPKDGSRAMIEAAFPMMDRKLISEMVDSIFDHDPPPLPSAEPVKQPAREPAGAAA